MPVPRCLIGYARIKTAQLFHFISFVSRGIRYIFFPNRFNFFLLCRPFAGMKVRFCLCLIYQSSSCTIPRSSSSFLMMSIFSAIASGLRTPFSSETTSRVVTTAPPKKSALSALRAPVRTATCANPSRS